MYRRSQKQKMAAEVQAANHEQFFARMWSLPVVTTAAGQLATIYGRTKESNRLVKFTLEKAENGVWTVTSTAKPMVDKFEKPIGALNSFACSQLDKLEEKYPVILKPTDQVLAETKKVYEHTLKPTVDRVTAITQYGVDRYNAAKKYSTDTVTSVTDFGKAKCTGALTYGTSTWKAAAETPYGKTVTAKVDVILDTTEHYVDEYLPKDEDETSKAEVDEVKTNGAVSRVTTLSDKVRRRMYARAMKELQHAQTRSRETLDKLSFTVNLIDYAKTNIDGVKGNMTAAKDRLMGYWQEINKDDSENEDENEDDKENKETEPRTFERRTIATLRHLTQHLKRGFATLPASFTYLPATVQDKVADAKKFSEELFANLSSAKSFEDVSHSAIQRARDSLNYLHESLNYVADYLASSPLFPKRFLKLSASENAVEDGGPDSGENGKPKDE